MSNFQYILRIHSQTKHTQHICLCDTSSMTSTIQQSGRNGRDVYIQFCVCLSVALAADDAKMVKINLFIYELVSI